MSKDNAEHLPELSQPSVLPASMLPSPGSVPHVPASVPSPGRVTGSFSGLNAFAVDPETGFLVTPESDDPVLGRKIQFSPALKLEFIRVLGESWPNISKACDAAHVSRWTYKNHYAMDARFRLLVDEIAERVTDSIEAVSVSMAHSGRFGVIDRMCQLRANRSEKYDPARRIVIEGGNRPDPEQAKARMVKLQGVVDAEVIRAVSDPQPQEGQP